MSAVRAFVGIDAGTTGCTVMIFDEHGNRLGEGYQEYPCISPRAGWVEQDVEDVWRGICAATKEAVTAAALPDEAYQSVGFSSQRGTFLLLDEDKNPLANSIVWNDGRALKYQAIFGEQISPEDYQTLTGMQLSPLWSAAKIAWLRDNEPDLFARTRWFANGQEYFLYRLGADQWVTDPASLTLNGMLDIEKLDWSDEVLALCGIDRDRLPPVGIPSGQAGVVSPAASYATGLPVGVPLCRGAGDQQCAAIGAGVVRQGMADSPSAPPGSWSPTWTDWTASRDATCGGVATPCPARGISKAELSPSVRISSGGGTTSAATSWRRRRHRVAVCTR